MATKDELRAQLEAAGAEQPPADAKKEDLEAAVAAANSSSEEAPAEQAETLDDVEGESTGFSSEASDPDEVGDDLSEPGQEALEEMAPEQAEKADLALDATGPLILGKPSERPMTGAVSPDHAKEQEELLKNKPDDFVGAVSEAGFDSEGQPVVSDSQAFEDSDEETRNAAEERQKRIAEQDPRENLLKDNLHESDDRQVQEVRQENVIDFGGNQIEREAARTGVAPEDVDTDNAQASDIAGPFANTTVAGASSRAFNQKSVLYTDGLSGTAESNLERAYEIPELLQSNDPEERAAGDESLSEDAKEARPEGDEAKAEEVINRDN